MSDQSRKVLHSCLEKNFMQVVDHEETRSLFFRNSVVQSRMSLKKPYRLILKYCQYMMAASLLIKPNPVRVLIVGVGAGSFLHFFKHFFPLSYVDGVDYSENVLRIARGYFLLPENDKITIHCDDGLHFLSHRTQGDGYDLILIDAFNDEGMAKTIYSREFLKLARENLSGEGIICCNLWSGNRDMFNHVKKAIEKNSRSNLFIPVRQRENIIALLFQSPLPWKKICPPSTELAQLKKRYHLDFNEVSVSAKKHNMKIGEKFQLLFS